MKFEERNPFKPHNPQTQAEWQCAADIAYLFLADHLGRGWGMKDDEGKVNIARCEHILARAKELMIQPRTLGPAGPGLKR